MLSRSALVFLGGVWLAGCGKGSQGGPGGGAPEVGVLAVSAETVVLTRELPGRTAPCLVAEIRPQASGILLNRLFTEGADVQADEVLYQIESSSYDAARAHAAAAVTAATANLSTARAAQSRARAGQANAQARVTAAQAGLAAAEAAEAAVEAALVAARAARSRAEANVVPLRLRAERFRELVANKAVSQQDADDTDAALRQAEAGLESAVAGVVAAEADQGRAAAAVRVAAAEVQSAEAGLLAAAAEIESAAAAVEAAQASVQAEAGLTTATIALGYTRITAPIAGRIGRSAVTSGALVAAHQPQALATIQQLDPIYVDVTQATADLLRLQRRLADGRLTHNGTRNVATLVLEDGTPYPHEGTLQFRDVTVDPSTGSFILRLVFPNPDKVLLPGMFVRAVIQEGVKDDAILIPQETVTRDAVGNPRTMVLGAEGTVEVRPLKVDRAIGGRWLVSAGLKPGDRVIVDGLQRLRPGMPARAAQAPAAGAAPSSPAAAPKAN